MNIQTIKSDIDFLCGSTSATYTDTNKIRNVNVAYNDVARLIWESEGAWAFDDSNNTDSPVATRTMAHASATYLVPTTAIRIEGVEIKDNASYWHKLLPIAFADFTIAPEQFLTGNGLPIYYQLEGNEITFYPAPASASVTLTSGMKVRLARNVTEFPVTATTTSPGFPTSFHRILSYAAAIDFTQDNTQRQFLVQQRARLEKGLMTYFSKRGLEYKTRILPAGQKRWKLYT